MPVDTASQYKIQVHNMRSKHSILMALLTVVLTACGGGGGGSSGAFSPPATGSTAPEVASVTVQSASPTIYSDNSQKVALTVYVRDANNNLLSNVPVTYAASAGGAVTGDASTGAGGTASATLSAINPTGATITVTATAGGKSGNATVNVVAAPAPPAAAQLSISTSTPTIPSNGLTGADVTATVKDASNRFLQGIAVDFTATSGGLSVVRGTTDASGTALAKLTASTDPTNRTITVTARSAGISSSIAVNVTGTRLQIQGPSAAVLGQQATYTVVLNDSGDKGIAGKTVTIASAKGNTLSNASLVTDSNGRGTFTLTIANPQSDTLTISALGLATTQQVSVNADSFAFTTPAADNKEIKICKPAVPCPADPSQVIVVRWLSGGQPVVNQPVTFATTRGSVGSGTVLTNANGEAQTTVTSTIAGGAVLSATSGNATAQRAVEFVAWEPTAIAVQASPFSLAPNEQSTITAVVRDANNNLVKNQTVTFNLTADNTGGSLSRASAVTDSQGRAQTVYTAGPVTSGPNGVTVTAAIQSAPAVTTNVALTVAQREVFISLGTGNTILEINNGTSYQIDFAIRVTDANGNAVPSARVAMSLLSLSYVKGTRVLNPAGTGWNTAPNAVCADEDNNPRNGVLDPGEDFNNSLRIEAGNIAAVTPRDVTTDENGFALVSVAYPQEYAYYVTVVLEARATVQGTEYARSSTFLLPGAASDFNDPKVTPPGLVSPFGVAADCANKN